MSDYEIFTVHGGDGDNDLAINSDRYYNFMQGSLNIPCKRLLGSSNVFASRDSKQAPGKRTSIYRNMAAGLYVMNGVSLVSKDDHVTCRETLLHYVERRKTDLFYASMPAVFVKVKEPFALKNPSKLYDMWINSFASRYPIRSILERRSKDAGINRTDLILPIFISMAQQSYSALSAFLLIVRYADDFFMKDETTYMSLEEIITKVVKARNKKLQAGDPRGLVNLVTEFGPNVILWFILFYLGLLEKVGNLYEREVKNTNGPGQFISSFSFEIADILTYASQKMRDEVLRMLGGNDTVLFSNLHKEIIKVLSMSPVGKV